MLEYNLIISGKPNFIAEDCIRNWDEISYSMKRDGFSGIVRSFSSKFEFTNEAYTMLMNEYVAKGLKTSAQIEIYELDNKRGKVFLFGSYLDLGSLEYDDDCVYINAVDSSLAAKLKAKKTTQYEYPVSDLKESEPLSYDRIRMKSKITWLFTGVQDSDEWGDHYRSTFSEFDNNQVIPLYIESSEIGVKNVIEVRDAYSGTIGTAFNGNVLKRDNYILQNISNRSISIHIDGHFLFDFEWNRITGGNTRQFIIDVCVYNGESLVSKNEYASKQPQMNHYYIDMGISLNPGDKLVIGAKTQYQYCTVKQYIADVKDQMLTITFEESDIPQIIDVVKPSTLLNKMLVSINDGKEGFVGEIDGDSDVRFPDTMLLAAESIRGIEGAKIYSSYKKFCDWMESVFGFVPFIDNNKVTFKKRDSLYNSVVQKKIGNNGYEFKVKIDSGNIYSAVKAGYEKQDYDSINGRDEFRFTNEYDTGVTITDNVLELISPYRADAYGIEFLAAKRGEDTTDSDSDKDMFFVAASLSDGKYTLIRNGYTIEGIVSPDTMFNAMFSPRMCIESNKGLISSFADNLIFASSSGNSEVIINGIAEKTDISFTDSDKMFISSVADVETADGKLPSDIHGLVEIERNGYLYTCFINEAEYKLGLYKGVKYVLQIKKITKL